MGENEIQTALREVKEEVGLDVEINTEKRYELNYIIENRIDKTTILYIAKPKNEDIVMQESEIANVKWCDYDEAVNILTFDNWKEMFRQVVEDLK